MRRFFLTAVAVFFACVSWAQDENVLVLDNDHSGYIGHHVKWWMDTIGQADFETAEKAIYQDWETDVLNFQINKSAIWLKINIRNESDHELFYLQVEYANLDTLSLHHYVDSQLVITTVGDRFPFAEREISHPSFMFAFKLKQGESKVMYLRARSADQLFLPIKIAERESIVRSNSEREIFLGIYFGIIISLFFYNLFIFLTTRDKSYFWYILYVAGIGLTQAAIEGILFQYIFPNSPGMHNFSAMLFSALTGLAAIEFAKDFVNPKKYTPFFYRGLVIFQIIYIGAIITYLFGWIGVSYMLVDMGALSVSIYALIFISIIAAKGYRPAKFFLLAWTVFLLGIFVFALRNLDVLPFNFLTNSIIQIGSGLEVIMLSIALADRINILKKEKEESQAKALEVSKENERIIREQKDILERMVEERTRQLETANHELEEALLTLKEAQSQLVDAEKMASLGQLTAGIAHEINNPINFVSANVAPLRRDIQDIRSLLDWLEGKVRATADPRFVEDIEKYKRDIEFDYVLDEIDGLLNGIEDGTQRTVEIVKGLKIFSRVDEQDIKFVDLHEGLDSTMILLNSGLKDQIVIQKDYGELPKVECYPGKLNQIFMNIINNAAQAILSVPERRGLIRVKTRVIPGKKVRIDFIDNGTGMSPDTKSKIFEPFFTTKPVGEGTGLGLSIVYNIIKSHNGVVEVESKLGEGTTFSIILPIQHSEK